MAKFRHRLATFDDLDGISELMDLAIAENMKAFLSAEEIEVARESMGLDRLLIEDQTYFVIEALPDTEDTASTANDSWVMVGCGGWGRRKTLYGGDHTVGRDDRFSDPATDPARIRAMYTHPVWVRQGIGARLLQLGEAAAKEAGYQTIELGATASGMPLYVAKGYRETERIAETGESGDPSGKVVIRMIKSL